MRSLKIILTMSCALVAVASSPANAAQLLFKLEGLAANKFNASFVFDTERPASITIPTGVRYNGIPITYTLPNSTTPITENGQFTGPTFQVLNNQGGFFYGFLGQAGGFNNRIQVFGPQLFTGTTANPVFAPGIFDLSDIPRQRTTDPLIVNYRLTISQVPGAVPEPATWMMMIGGMAAIGATMRQRKRRASAAFA